MKKRYLITIVMLAAMLFMLPMLAAPVSAAEVASGTCTEGITWSVRDTGVLTISGIGAMPDYAFDSAAQAPNSPWYSYESQITAVVVEEGITYVGEYAFMNLYGVSSVSLPSTLTGIGGHAFQHSRLLTSVSLPEGLETIGEYAFGIQFAELRLPNSLKSLGCLAFDAQKVYIDTLEHWLDLEFVADKNGAVGVSGANPLAYDVGELYIGGVLATDIVLPEGTTEISPYKFYQLTSMTSITIPESVTMIGEGAFWGCDGLTEITIPDSVASLGGRILMECSNLTSAVLPAGLTEIPESTFRECVNLKVFTMPENVTGIGENAFAGCANLERFSETNSLEKVTYLGGRAFVGCKKLAFGDLVLSENLFSLGSSYTGYTFAWCEGLTSVTIPDNVSSIPMFAFQDCVNLQKIVIGSGVTEISQTAFYNCSKLTSVILPKSVATINANTFEGCSSLVAVYILNESCTIAEPTTNGNTGATVYPLGTPGVTTVYGEPGSTAEAYAASHGFTFANVPKTCEFGHHTYASVVAKEVTCMENGTRIITCSVCGDSYEEEIVCEGHSTASGTCTGCGVSVIAQGSNVDGLLWALTSDGTLTITSPVMEYGYSYEEPWDTYAAQVKKIVLGHNISGFSLGEIAYDPAAPKASVYPNLTAISLNAKVESVNFPAEVPALTDIIIHEDNPRFFVSDGILYQAHDAEQCTMVFCPGTLSKTSLRIPDSVTYISPFALKHAQNLKKVYVPCDVFPPEAFRKCSGLTDIYIFTTDYFLPYGPWEEITEPVFGEPGKITIHGYKSSFAETLAERMGYRFVELTPCDVDGHVTEAVEKVAETCVSAGTAAHYKCTVCNQLYADATADTAVTAEELVLAIDGTAHTGKTETKNAKAATCTAEGYTGDTHCADCGVKLADGKAIEKLAHDYSVKEAVVAPTHDGEGYTVYRCSGCDATERRDILPPLGHQLTYVAAKAASCTEAGNVEYWHCESCGKNYAEETAITEVTELETAAQGHEWDDGTQSDRKMVYKCLHCKEEKVLQLPPVGMEISAPPADEELQNSILTEAEKERVQKGEKAEIYLEVADISNSLTAEEKEKIHNKLAHGKIGVYLDISLFKQVGEDRPVKVSEPGKKVQISIKIPDFLLNKDVLFVREYWIIRVHNGVAERLNGHFDKSTNTFTYETDGFSTYALVYADTELNTPPTGDAMNGILCGAVLTFSAVLVICAVYGRKRFYAE